MSSRLEWLVNENWKFGAHTDPLLPLGLEGPHVTREEGAEGAVASSRESDGSADERGEGQCLELPLNYHGKEMAVVPEMSKS